MLSVGRGNACGLLPAMLQRIEPQIGLPRRIRMAVDGDDAALFAQLVIVMRQSARRRVSPAAALPRQ